MLPIRDGWLVFARVLTLSTLLPTLPITLQPGRSALVRLVRLPFAIRESASGKAPLSATARLRQRRRQLRRDEEAAEISSDSTYSAGRLQARPQRSLFRRLTNVAWTSRAVAVAAWVAVAAASTLLLAGGTLSETGEGIASAAEVLGAIGSTTSGFIVPGPSTMHSISLTVQRSSGSCSSTRGHRARSSSPGPTPWPTRCFSARSSSSSDACLDGGYGTTSASVSCCYRSGWSA